MWAESLYVALSVLVIYITRWIYKWHHPKCNGILPPGSMGFPLIGETIQLFATGYSLDLPPFVKKRVQRYGPVFRTSLGGRPVVVSTDPGFNNFIVLQEGVSVELWYLDTFAKLFSQEGGSKMSATGAVHKYVRSAALNLFGYEALRTKLLPQVEEEIHKTLHSWCKQSSVDVKHAVSTMILDLMGRLMLSYDSERYPSEKISDYFADFMKGFMSFPLNIPGTAFHKCLQGHKRFMKKMKEIVKQKQESPGACAGDLLDQAIKDMETEEFLNENFIANLVFALLFAASESISVSVALLFKFLCDHPAALQDLRAEHEGILRRRENSESSLTWDEYKTMTFTLQVVNETLRLGSQAPGLLRRTTKDVTVNGYTIPRAWTIMMVTPALHLNPDTFKDPLVFNPWRWKELDSSVVSKNFMPFGGGKRQCAGSDFTRVFMATFLHVLVTNYRWTSTKVGKIRRSPTLGFGDGVHIHLSKIQCENYDGSKVLRTLNLG